MYPINPVFACRSGRINVVKGRQFINQLGTNVQKKGH